MRNDGRSFPLVFLPLWILAGVVLLYVGREVYGRYSSTHRMMERVTVHPDRPLSVPHPVFGRFSNTGTFDVTISVPKTTIPYHFRVVTDADGYRTTSDPAERFAGRPEVWVFGCSFTWGMPLDNQDTYPWLLQDDLADCRVRNLGVYAYGNHHALLQLRELLKDDSEAVPKVAVFAYCSFHRKRNVAAPSWLRLENSIRKQPEEMRYPRASLKGGQLEIELVSYDAPQADRDPTEEQTNQVTLAIFREIRELCRSRGIRPIVAVQTHAGATDTVPEGCRDELGFTMVDMVVDVGDPRFNVLPYNSHPNAAAHRIYADRLLPVIRRLLEAD